MRFIDLADGNALQDLQCGRGGDGENAMGAVNRPVAVVQAGNQHLVHSKSLNADTGADDIRDGIERPDFMELDVFGRLAVNFALGDRDALENGQRALLHELRQLAVLDQFADLAMAAAVRMRVAMPVLLMMVSVHLAAMIVVMFVRVWMGVRLVGMPVFVRMLLSGTFVGVGVSVLVFVAVRMGMRGRFFRAMRVLVGMLVRMGMGVRMGVLVVMMMPVPMIMSAIGAVFMGFILVVRVGRAFVDAEFHALHGLAFLPLEVHVEIANVELGKLPFQRGGFDAEIDERADRHIAADAGETIEEENFHERIRLGFKRDGTSRFRGD